MSALLQERPGTYSRSATASEDDFEDEHAAGAETASTSPSPAWSLEGGRGIQAALVHEAYVAALIDYQIGHLGGKSPWAIDRVCMESLTSSNFHFGTGSRLLAIDPSLTLCEVIAPILRPKVDNKFDSIKARLRMLKRLPANHDGEGAAAANEWSVDAAIFFLGSFTFKMRPSTTLDDDGNAVFEFRDRTTGFFGDITFKGRGMIEAYVRRPGEDSKMVSGRLHDAEMVEFLASMGCVSRGG